jgi:hypothetical protein
MEIHRSFGVSRLVALMAAHRGRSAHSRLLGRLDQLVAEASMLCRRAEQLHPEGSIADAFLTELARPTRDWMERAETVVATVRPIGDTICGARARELRVLIDHANVAMMRVANGREAWRGFHRAVLDAQDRAAR